MISDCWTLDVQVVAADENIRTPYTGEKKLHTIRLFVSVINPAKTPHEPTAVNVLM